MSSDIKKTGARQPWPQVPLETVVESLTVGLPVARYTARTDEPKISEPVLSVGDLEQTGIAPRESIASIALRVSDYERFRIRSKDVLFSARATTLKAAGVGHEHEGMLVSSNLIIVRPAHQIGTSLLVALLRSPLWQSQLRRKAQGRSSSSIIQLTNRDLRDLMVPLPPLDIQAELIALIDAEERYQRFAHEAARRRRKLVDTTVLETLLPENPA